VPRFKLSRFDVPCHNVNQPSLIAFGKLSLRFCLFACRTIRFIRPSREFSHPDDAHGIRVLRSFIPVSRAVAVSSNHSPHAVNDLPPSINFRRGIDRHILLMPLWVAQRSITFKFIRLLGFSLVTVRSVVESETTIGRSCLGLSLFQGLEMHSIARSALSGTEPSVPGIPLPVPIRSWVYGQSLLMVCSPDKRYQIQPAHCRPFSVFMRLMPCQSIGIDQAAGLAPCLRFGTVRKGKAAFLSLFASVIKSAWRNHSSQRGA